VLIPDALELFEVILDQTIHWAGLGIPGLIDSLTQALHIGSNCPAAPAANEIYSGTTHCTSDDLGRTEGLPQVRGRPAVQKHGGNLHEGEGGTSVGHSRLPGLPPLLRHAQQKASCWKGTDAKIRP
jgi:hypothetical protein